MSEDEVIEESKYIPFDDVSKMYKYGYSTDPIDKKPYEMSARCFYCFASFSIEN